MWTVFHKITIGQLYHTGISKGIGATSEQINQRFEVKISKSESKIVKWDYCPRFINQIEKRSPNFPVFIS